MASFMKKKRQAQGGAKKIGIFKLLPRKRRKTEIMNRVHFFSKLSSFFFLLNQPEYFFCSSKLWYIVFFHKNPAPPGYQMERPL